MRIWIDAQLPPQLAAWMTSTLGVRTEALRDLGLRDAKDVDIFRAAHDADAIVVTKDSDFVRLLEANGPPPRVLWITLGNCSNEHLREAMARKWPQILELFAAGEPLVELADDPRRAP